MLVPLPLPKLILSVLSDSFTLRTTTPLRLRRSSTYLAFCLLTVTIGVDARAETLYVPSQFATIQAALAQARLDRLSTSETIVIHVASGKYVETLPLILDIPNLQLEGETTLTMDANGVPTGFVGSGSTQLLAKPALSGVQTVLLIGPTSNGTGNGVTVQGLVLDAGTNGSTGDGRDITIDRVALFSIRRNVLLGAGLAMDFRAAGGVIEENFITGNGCGACLSAGNALEPASYSFVRNRSVKNAFSGLVIVGSSYDGVQHPALVPIEQGEIFDSITAVIDANDLSGNKRAPNFTSGLRFFAFTPTVPQGQSTGSIQATVTNNTITNNSFGVVIDAGFPWRDDPRVWAANFNIVFSRNTVSVSKKAQALITFTRFTTSLDSKELNVFKYLTNSLFSISDFDNSLSGYWFDNPLTDPISGLPLQNTLVVNGVATPPGRGIP
jgi:hypothetical protein